MIANPGWSPEWPHVIWRCVGLLEWVLVGPRSRYVRVVVLLVLVVGLVLATGVTAAVVRLGDLGQVLG